MNERLKEVRKYYGLNQGEFATRIGVRNTAISRYENGERDISEQVVLAVCREYNISENWLRTGVGEMRIATKDALIQQMADTYNLSALGQAIVEGYLNLPDSHKAALENYVVSVARSYGLSLGDEIADELAAFVNEAEDRKFNNFNRPLSKKEQADLLRSRADALEKGVPSSLTFESPLGGVHQVSGGA